MIQGKRFENSSLNIEINGWCIIMYFYLFIYAYIYSKYRQNMQNNLKENETGLNSWKKSHKEIQICAVLKQTQSYIYAWMYLLRRQVVVMVTVTNGDVRREKQCSSPSFT